MIELDEIQTEYFKILSIHGILLSDIDRFLNRQYVHRLV